MACAGVDFGNKTAVVAIARRGGIDICCNEVSNRATPTIVSFQTNERHMGEAAASIAAQNHRNTISSVQRLLGVPAADEFSVVEGKRVTCPLVPDPATGTTAAKVAYSGIESETGDEIFTMQQVMAMLLSNLMSCASNEYKAPVKDLVISVPVYYTEAQRRAVLDAAAIADMNVLRVVNEHAATALSYGIFRTKELPETTPIKVAFVDIGEASTTVSITAFTNARCDVLSVKADPNLGGRDLDDIIFNKFAAEFKEKYSIDVPSKPKPTARLRKECEKMKKILSANAEAPLNIECLMDDADVKGHMTRDELESIAAPVLERVRIVCEAALAEAGLKEGEQLAAVEVVGGSTRVPAFRNIITEAFKNVGAPVRTTLNADEFIARGCALMSAMLSPAFRVRDYAVCDISTHALVAEKIFTDGSPPESFVLVKKSNPIPCLKTVTFKSRGPLTINVRYADPSLLTIQKDQPQICGYLIDAPVDPEAKVRAKIRVTANSTVELASAQLQKEVEVEEEFIVKKEEKTNGTAAPAADAPVANGEAKPEAGTPPPEAGPADTPMADAPTESDKPAEAKPADAPAPEAPKEESKEAPKKEATPEPEAAPVMETRLVKKIKSTDLVVTLLPDISHGLTSDMVMDAMAKEARMRANDLYIKERSEAKNSLEAYVYDVRSRIDDYGDLKDYGLAEVRAALKSDLDESEEWIYSEEADEASKSAFVEKKRTLVERAAPMLFRKKEFEERPVRINVLEASIQNYKQVAVTGVEEYAHIADAEKEKLLKCVETASMWLKQEITKQQPLAKDVDPILTCQALTDKLSEIDGICRPIQNTPKPKPKEEEKKEEPKEGKSDEKMEDAEPKENGTEVEEVPVTKDAKSDQMEVENPEGNGETTKQ